jgi:thioredoxin reductase (NADPH)
MENIENVIILGDGMAGCSAAIYNARAGLDPLVISGPESGGQVTLTTEIENFTGFPEGIMGPELAMKAKAQAEKFGTRFKADVAVSFEKKGQLIHIGLESGEILQTKSLIIATGASARWLGLPSEEKFKGKGVSVCATCDAFFYKGKEVLVVGGGDSAMEEATFLTRFATKVTIVHVKDAFNASKPMQDRFFATPKTAVLWNKQIMEILGDNKGVTGAKLKDTVTEEISEVKCDGIFLAIGRIPNTSIFKGKVDMDAWGYIKTDSTKTNVPGVFAAGDVQDPRYRQAIVAAGSGVVASLEAERYLEKMKDI